VGVIEWIFLLVQLALVVYAVWLVNRAENESPTENIVPDTAQEALGTQADTRRG
jgi:Na+-transporting methylmalonyl-CoA/oxaloacetate decarboxylase gamma subunit